MKKHKRLPALGTVALLTTMAAALCPAANLDLSVNPGVAAQQDASKPQNVSPGVGVAVKNPLLNVNLDYKFQAQIDESGLSHKDKEAQRLGAALNSRRLDQLLGFRTQLRADSLYRAGGDSYLHRISPGFTTPLAQLATLNLNYQYSLNKPAAAAAEQEEQSYSLGLRGSLDNGRLNWSGAWRSADIQVGQPLTRTMESFNFRSDYQIIPEVKLELSSVIRQSTNVRANSEVNHDETRYGAGFSWAPSEFYSVRFAVNHMTKSSTGEEKILRSGSFNWNPLQDLQFILNYGDQLIEGARGVLLTTELDLGRL
ncbi:MAG: hypothetical protein HKN19_04515 [Halioglobus sp.]|nr:hypothetical protein [Halioglobus sp.]